MDRVRLAFVDDGRCDAGAYALYYYERPEQYQYLYETYPDHISPLVGIEDEHFMVWIRAVTTRQVNLNR